VLQLASDYNLDPVPGICILLVGLAILFWVVGFGMLIWNNFKMTVVQVIFIVTGLLLFYSFQLLAILKDNIEVSFFGLSAVFLSLNGMVMSLMAFIAFGSSSATLLDVIKIHIPNEQNGTKGNDKIETVDELI